MENCRLIRGVVKVLSQILVHFFNKSDKRKYFICDSTKHLIAKCPFKIKEAHKENGAKQQERASINSLHSPTKEYKGNRIQVPFTIKMLSKETVLENGIRLTKGFVNG